MLFLPLPYYAQVIERHAVGDEALDLVSDGLVLGVSIDGLADNVPDI